MSSRRSKRICLLAQQRQTVHRWETELVDQKEPGPKYESTKGSASFEQLLAIRGWHQLENEKNTEIVKMALEDEIKSLREQVALENKKATNENFAELKEIYSPNEIESEENGKETMKGCSKIFKDGRDESFNQNENVINAMIDAKSTKYKLDLKQNELASYDMNIKKTANTANATGAANNPDAAKLTKSAKKTTSQEIRLDNSKCTNNSDNSIAAEHDITSTLDDTGALENKRKYFEDGYDSVSEEKTSGSEYIHEKNTEIVKMALEDEIKSLREQVALENKKATNENFAELKEIYSPNEIESKENGKETMKGCSKIFKDGRDESFNQNENVINAMIDAKSTKYKLDLKQNELASYDMNIKKTANTANATGAANNPDAAKLTKSAKKTTSQEIRLDNSKCTNNSDNSIAAEHDITSTLDDTGALENKRKYFEDGYDSVSEEKTSGSEYIPSSSEELDSPHSYSLGYEMRTSKTSNSKDNGNAEIKKEQRNHKRQTRQRRQEDAFCPNAYVRSFDLNEPSSSGYKSDSSVTMHYSNLGEAKVTSSALLKPNPAIKVISNIQIKPSTKSSNRASVTDVDCIRAPAESTTRSNDCSTNINLVQISAAKQTLEGKRIRDKKHSCYYCHEMILHIARHLEAKHANEMDVARALAFPKNFYKRKELFLEITRAGDFHYNCEVLALKQGELILVRRPTINEINFNKYRDYGPCPNCLGFLLKKHIWHHLKTKCSKKDQSNQSNESDQPNKQVIAESNAILNCVFGTEFSDDYLKYIVNTLREDDVGACCKDDNLILRFGSMQFEKYGTTQSEFIRQNMRQLARLTITVREMTPQNLKLVDLLTPPKFDLIVQGVKELCRRHQDDSTKRPEFMIPSLALKLGYSLKKCANIERGLALKQENLRRNESLLAFCHLMELEWQIRISSNALSSLHKRKLNAGQLLPVTNDLLKCNNHIKTEILKAQAELTKLPTAENWSRLAKLILCRIILFNKRRAGEASNMTLEQYASRPLWSEQTNQELKTALTPYELKLAERYVVVNIIGKRGRFVPVLLTPETKTAIDVLNNHRDQTVGIHLKNPYLFARGLQALTHMRGPDVLKKIVSELETLEKPELITSTKLRKYVATVCQIFDLSENEYDWLARHLGHDIRVHREFYRMHEDVVELTKVSRLLMAVDNGEANKFAGMQLKDITLAELPPLEEEEEDAQWAVDNLEGIGEERSVDNNDSLESAVTRNNDQLLEDIGRNVIKKRTLKGLNRSTKSIQWDPEIKKEVIEYFRRHIKNETVPGKVDCEACQEKIPFLKNRKWTDIKFCVKNHITKIKKIKRN